eukprot:3221437-Prymnesium_polylepis.1
MAASEAAKEAIYLKHFLEQFGLQDPEQPVTLGCDNQAAMNLAYNPEHHKRVTLPAARRPRTAVTLSGHIR